MDAGKKLKWVHIFSARIEDYAKLPKIKDDLVAITSLKIYPAPEIADHAFALLLGLTLTLDGSGNPDELDAFFLIGCRWQLRSAHL